MLAWELRLTIPGAGKIKIAIFQLEGKKKKSIFSNHSGKDYETKT